MALDYFNLDEKTRKFMVDEIRSDESNNKLYFSPRLFEHQKGKYFRLLLEATTYHDDGWFANEIRNNNLLKSYEERKRGNKIFSAKVPVNAPDMLAEGEFNRYYSRGLCLRAIDEKIEFVVVYRAKQVSNPRPDSEIMIGKSIKVKELLNDLRTHQGVEPALGLPPGPNSGLSVKLP